MQAKPRIFSFILRVWRAGDGGRPQWCASLEDIYTRERRGFATLEELCRYLKQQTRLTAAEKESHRKK